MEVAADRAGMSADRLEWITDHFKRMYIAPGKIAGCQILVARRGFPAYWRSFGQRDIARNKPVSDDTLFRIYSMSKPVTSVALMQLYERGCFQLNDPVERVLPEFKGQKVWLSGEGDDMVLADPTSPMTFRNVLSHTGGLSYGWDPHPVDAAYRTAKVHRGPGMTVNTFLERIGSMPLRYDPGSKWLYSMSTDVCGAIVERLSGVPFDEYLAENIFKPLGMKDTAFHVSSNDSERLAANYRRAPDKSLELIDDPVASTYLTKPTFPSGGGGLVSTTEDYFQFCDMLRRGGELSGERIIGPRTLSIMHMNHLPGDADLTQFALGSFSETAYSGVGFGLGFAMTLGEVEAGGVGHGDYYWGGAASTIFWIDPREELVVIFMTQLMPSGTFNFRGQLKNMVYAAIEN